MLNPSEIKVPPTSDQLYAMLGELVVENRLLKSIIAQHPEVIAAHNAEAPSDPPSEVVSGEVIEGG